MDIDKATATQLANIEKRTGKTLAQLEKMIKASGLTKHGELVAMLKQDDALMKAISKFGPFEIAPKKDYVSLRGKKQFAMIGPATNTQVEIGLNMKNVKGTARLVEQKPGGMCQYKVRVGDKNEVDAQLVGWIRQAYDAAQ